MNDQQTGTQALIRAIRGTAEDFSVIIIGRPPFKTATNIWCTRLHNDRGLTAAILELCPSRVEDENGSYAVALVRVLGEGELELVFSRAELTSVAPTDPGIAWRTLSARRKE